MDFSVLNSYWDLIFKGIQITILSSIGALVLGFILGTILVIGRLSKLWLFQLPSRFIITVIRGTPSLVQIYIIYFGLTQIGLTLGGLTAGILALGINSSGYVAEILRAGIKSINKGQVEAARSLGFSQSKSMRLVVWPQAFWNILPPLGSEFITVVKNSSLLSTIAVAELTYTGALIRSETYASFEVFLLIAVVYLSLTSVIYVTVLLLEKSRAKKGLGVR